MKEKLKDMNNEYKEKLISSLNMDRVQIITYWKNNREEILKLNPIQKFIRLYRDLPTLSMYRDNEVLSLLESFGITKLTTKFFVPIEDFFKLLDEFQETHNYYYLYITTWFYYNAYSLNFFRNQLAFDFGLDLKKITAKVKRQEKNGNLHVAFEPLKNRHKEIKELINQEMPDHKFPFDGGSIIKSTGKVTNFPHKIYFYNLYMQQKSNNLDMGIFKFNEPDFKCEFYDLLSILLRDKSILNDGIEEQLKYGEPGSRRFKIKRVERLILS